jgi:hypothetical protein
MRSTPSVVAPTAFTYAGTDPSANNAEPMMNSHAIAALRATGRTVIMCPMLSGAELIKLRGYLMITGR